MGRSALSVGCAAVLALALSVAACSGGPPPPSMCTGTGGFSGGAPDEGFAVAGDDLAVTLRLAVQCPSDVEVRASVAVHDPNNLPAMLTEGEAMRVLADSERVAGQGIFTTIKIRTMLPGPYHFTARFEPNLGLVQRDVFVAENRRDAGAELTVPGGPGLISCKHIDVTQGGRPLCLSGLVRLFDGDGGAVLQTLSTTGTAVAARSGDVLWLIDNMALTRWVEGPQGFSLSPDASYFHGAGSPALPAADSDGVLFAGSFGGLRSVSFSDGGLVTRSQSLDLGVPAVAVWKSGLDYLVLGEQFQQTTLCSGRFQDAGNCSVLSNFGMNAFPAASEPAGLWTWSEDINFFPTVRTLTLRTNAAARELVLPAGWTPRDAGMAFWDTGAVLDKGPSEQLFVADKRGQFMLQKFPAGQLLSVTGTWVALRDASGKVFLYRR